MSNITCLKLPATLLAVFAFASPTLAQSPLIEIESATRINRANEMVREGKFAKAIEGYRDAQPVESNRDELTHNLAVAQFRNGDVEAARTLFSEAAASSNASLASSSRYNLGNCFYSDAVKLAEQDKPAAIESLREAISHYRGSLAGNPNNVDARANIESAAKLIRKLEEEQEQEEQEQSDQQQQEQQQPDQQQESSDQNQSDQQQQDEQNPESQNQDASENESQQGDKQDESTEQDPSDQQDQSAESKPEDQPSDQSQENQSDSQESEGSESKADQAKNDDAQSGEPSSESQSAEQSPEQPKPSEQNPDDRPANNQSQHQNMQSRADDQQQPGEPTSEEDNEATEQAVPEGELTAADEQQASDKPHGQVAVHDPNAKDELMTKQEALKMLQAVRDRDMLRRLKQEQQQRSRHVRVDRDW